MTSRVPLYAGLGYGNIGISQDKHCVVLELGHAFTKIGFVNEPAPRAIIPTEIALRPNGPAKKLFEMTTQRDLSRGIWLFLETIYFRHLAVNAKEGRVIIVESIFWPASFRRELAKVLFTQFDIPGLLFVPHHLMVLNTLALSSGLVVDFGHREVVVYPISHGITILEAIRCVPLGASALHARLHQELLDKNASFKSQSVDEPPTSQDEAASPNTASAPPTPRIPAPGIESLSEEMLNEIKIKTCFVAPLARGLCLARGRINSSKTEGDKSTTPQLPSHPIARPPPDVKLLLSSGHTLCIPGSVRESAAEVLFELYGGELSVSAAILDALTRVPLDLRRSLAGNIVLVGGGTALPGLAQRLADEVTSLADTEFRGRIHISDETSQFAYHTLPCKSNYAAWLGGAIYGSSEMVALKSVSRDSYLKNPILPYDWASWYPQSG